MQFLIIDWSLKNNEDHLFATNESFQNFSEGN